MGLPIGMGTRWRITSLSLTPLLHVTLNERVFFRKNDFKSSENLLILTDLRVTEISVIVNLHNVCVAKVLKSS